MAWIIGHREVGIVSAFNFIIHAGMAHVAASRMVNSESSLTADLIMQNDLYRTIINSIIYLREEDNIQVKIDLK